MTAGAEGRAVSARKVTGDLRNLLVDQAVPVGGLTTTKTDLARQ